MGARQRTRTYGIFVMAKQELKYSEELLRIDMERLAQDRVKAKALLLSKGANDILEMLGLEDDDEL